MDCCWVQVCVASVERKKERGIDWGRWSPHSFRALLPVPLSGLFAPALQAIEFAQYSFTVHNKVVVAAKYWIRLTVPSKRHRENYRCSQLTTMHQ